MAILHRPDLDNQTFDQLYEGLSPELKLGVDRIMWTFKRKLINMPGVDQGRVLDFELTKEDLKLLYDPVLPDYLRESLDEEEQLLAMAAIDPVAWVRLYLNYEPRAYQIIMLRDRSRTRAFRCGRRTGKTTCMIWEALWFAYTNPSVFVIIICPLESQVKTMWEMVDDMLLHSGIRPLKQAIQQFGITAKIRKPWEITFSNGSRIKAFTSGARSGGKADSVRGNEGHMIIVDEMDLMMPDDLNAITAMMQQTSETFIGDKRLVVSSTPNGRRDMFYSFCEKSTLKEFWYPSFVNPYFSPADEAEQRDFLTETGFIHEIVADWGQQTTGVFKPQLLDHVAAEPYSYWHVRPKGYRGPIILGVDWDKYGAGVNLVGVANVGGVLRTVIREEIERSAHEHTLGAGVERVKQLDKMFGFAYVYCDRGYGERQYEELTQELPYGTERVIGKNYSSSVLETDPATRETVKEEFKPFMVDNAVNLYEKRKVLINPDDEKFMSQLLGYVMLRISATGRPVFGSMDEERIGDHALEGWMMALLGHTEQFGDLIERFESITPKTAHTNIALTPGDSREDKEKKAAQFSRFSRPMSAAKRAKSMSVFNRPGL